MKTLALPVRLAAILCGIGAAAAIFWLQSRGVSIPDWLLLLVVLVPILTAAFALTPRSRTTEESPDSRPSVRCPVCAGRRIVARKRLPLYLGLSFVCVCFLLVRWLHAPFRLMGTDPLHWAPYAAAFFMLGAFRFGVRPCPACRAPQSADAEHDSTSGSGGRSSGRPPADTAQPKWRLTQPRDGDERWECDAPGDSQ